MDRLKQIRRFILLFIKILFCNKIKLIIGAEKTTFEGWIPTDIDLLDIRKIYHWRRLFHLKRIEKIVAEHVFEHLTMEEIRNTLNIISGFMIKNGNLRIAVPDGYHTSKYVIDLTKPNGLEVGADDHKVLLNIDSLSKIVDKKIYIIKPVEFFNKNGKFFRYKNDIDNGYIKRSSEHYRGRFTSDRNELKKMISSIPEKIRNDFLKENITYTSLIVDLIKK